MTTTMMIEMVTMKRLMVVVVMIMRAAGNQIIRSHRGVWWWCWCWSWSWCWWHMTIWLTSFQLLFSSSFLVVHCFFLFFCWLLHCCFVSFFWLLHCIGGALPEGSSITLLHIDFSPPWKTAWIEELTFEIESKLNFNENFISLGLVLGWKRNFHLVEEMLNWPNKVIGSVQIADTLLREWIHMQRGYRWQANKYLLVDLLERVKLGV